MRAHVRALPDVSPPALSAAQTEISFSKISGIDLSIPHHANNG